MDNALHIENHGPLITASNYWDTEMARAGYAYLSVNAGAFRLLLPDSCRGWVPDMRAGCRHIVVSALAPDDWEPNAFAVEWMSEDGSDEPWAAHLSPGQIDRCPTPADAGKQWLASVWIRKRGNPHKVFERPAYFQRVPQLPWMKAIS